uniref:AKNA domain-containing protein n=1 Tax=Coturnix japonica TaxID=93934 RepID=A0A8C2UFT2_COTJA
MSCSVSNELSYITDTTDAEQDDLPCDGDGGIACKYHSKSDQLNGCTCIVCISDSLNLPCSGDNRNASANDDIHVQDEGAFDCNTGTIRTVRSKAGIAGSEVSFTQALPAGGSQPDGTDPPSHSNMSHVLLRHFPMGELMSTWQFIERETIPETSLTESIDEATNKHETSERVKGPSTGEQEAAKFEEHHLQRLKAVNIFQNTEQRRMLKKSVSSHELIEDQGEVQSRQEGHNEVTSEMKVPEMSENKKSVPTIKRTKPFPRLLNQSVTGNNVLENQEEMSIPEPSQQRKILPQSGFPNAGFAIYSGAPEDSTANTCVLLQPAHGLSEPRLPCGTTTSALPATRTVEIRCLNASNLLPETTQGEKMSQILKDQTDQLKTKVEDFSKHMTRETSLLQEDYLVLNQLKTHLDALERNYLTAREEHRNLQLQCYKDKSTGIGEFDPERFEDKHKKSRRGNI